MNWESKMRKVWNYFLIFILFYGFISTAYGEWTLGGWITQPGWPVPTLTSPEDGSVIEGPFINFECEAAQFTWHMQIQISKSHSFLELIVDTIVRGREYTFPTVLLEPEKIYFWRVQGQNFEKGVIKKSEWTQPWKFRVKKIEPSDNTSTLTPILRDPEDGKVLKGLGTMLYWNIVPEATYYRIQVSSSKLFKETILDGIATVPCCDSIRGGLLK